MVVAWRNGAHGGMQQWQGHGVASSTMNRHGQGQKQEGVREQPWLQPVMPNPYWSVHPPPRYLQYLPLGSSNNLSGIRALRALRALRAINAVPGGWGQAGQRGVGAA
jgi:hypothetical protein